MNCDLLDRFKYFILAGFVIATAAGLGFSARLDLDPSLESRFLRDNPQLRAYKEFSQGFGSEPLLLVVYEGKGDIWQDLPYIRELTQKIEKLGGVESVISIATIHGVNDARAKGADVDTLKRLPLIRKLMVDGEARRSVLLIMPTQEAASPSAGVRLVREVEGVIGERAFVTGPLAMQSKAIEFSRRDLARTLLIVAISVVVLFLIAYRSWQAIAAALLVTGFALSCTCGILAALHVKLSQFALIALPILAVAGLEDVVFLLRHYVAARNHGAERVEACRQMFSSSGVPCFWTTATTIAGFASLLTGNIEQIRSIGLLYLVGGPLALLASLLIVPCLMLALPMKARTQNEPSAARTSAFVSFVSGNARWLAAGFIVASVVAGYGIRFANVRFDFPKIFRPQVAFQKQFQEVDEKLAGAASFEIVLKTNDGTDFSDLEKLNLMRRLQVALSLTGPVTTTVSPIDVGLTAYVIKNGIPENPRELLKNAGHLVTKIGEMDASPLSGWLSRDMKEARVHVRVRTDREKYFDQLLSTLAYLRDGYRTMGVEMTWSGFALLYKEMERRMLNALISSSASAFICVLIMLMILLRSVKWGLVAMIPNILPIAMVIGIIGWAGIGFSLGLIILPAVGIGLIVDDTIHFIWGVRRFRRMGLDMRDAVAKVLSTSGTAMVLATLILVAGFASLAVSPFVSNVQLAIFMPLLLLLALLFDLVGVPVMLFLRRPRRKRGENT